MDMPQDKSTTAGLAGMGFLVGAAVSLLASMTLTSTETPEVCMEALDAAETVHDHSGEAFLYAGQGFGAIADGDMAALGAATDALQRIQPQHATAVDTYRELAQQCRKVE